MSGETSESPQDATADVGQKPVNPNDRPEDGCQLASKSIQRGQEDEKREGDGGDSGREAQAPDEAHRGPNVQAASTSDTDATPDQNQLMAANYEHGGEKRTVVVGSQERRPQREVDVTDNPEKRPAKTVVSESSVRRVQSGEAVMSPHPKAMPLQATDFEYGDLLGEGAYSRVLLATRKSSQEQYAIKVMEKRHIIKEKKQGCVKMERDVLNMLDHPNIIQLVCTFQDSASLYFVLEIARGGELFELIKEFGTLGEPICKFYMAELLTAVEYLHSKNVVHRDLKPENILLSDTGHIKITDFGTARVVGDSHRNTFCGTAEYVSPEVLQDQGARQSSDIWAVGCITFQSFAGSVPFRGGSEYLTFQLILNLDYAFPEPFPEDAKDFVEKTLVLDFEKRLGAGSGGIVDDYASIKSHPFFSEIDWTDLHLQAPPPRTAYKQKVPELEPHRPDDPEVIRLTQEWAAYIRPGEKVLHAGLVIKKAGLFSSKKRQMLLTNQNRLVYIDMGKMIVKGEIETGPDTKPLLKNSREFVVRTPKRAYYFDCQSQQAERWVDEIHQSLVNWVNDELN